MGTRADFYVGRGEGAEWLGSIAFDGYPDGNPQPTLAATTEAEYRAAVTAMFAEKSDQVSLPARGWPWSWANSQTTDYAYAFDDGKVWASYFGRAWFDPLGEEPETDDDTKPTVFPNMTSRQNVARGHRSGLLVFRIGPQGCVTIE